MSDMTAPNHPHGLGYARVAGKWGWFVALGLVSIAAGLFALVETDLFAIFSVIFIGASMLVSGIFQIIHSFATKGWGQFALNLSLGILYTVGGWLIMQEPIEGSVIITLFLSIALTVGGVLRAVIAFRHREVRYWWLMAIGGLISVALGVLLYSMLPWASLWVLGTLIGIELLIQGMTWLQFGLGLRRHHK
jgi:uncharacterized membrane protein HdeD (DUF308 family)